MNLSQVARDFSNIFQVGVSARKNAKTPSSLEVRSMNALTGEAQYQPWSDWWQDNTSLSYRWPQMIKEYEQMDEYSEIKIALDTYADEVSQPDPETGMSVHVEGSDKAQVERVKDLLFNKLRIEDNIWALARRTAKFGNLFDRLKWSDKGIEAIIPATGVKEVEPMLTDEGMLGAYKIEGRELVRYKKMKKKQNMLREKQGNEKVNTPGMRLVPPWDYCHYKILGDKRHERYGSSMIEPARKIWKKLEQLENAVAIYRLMRAPDRLVYLIDVGDNTEPLEALAVTQEYQKQIKQRYFLDKDTGDYKVGLHPAAIETDIFWPTRPSANSRVERLQGGADIQSIVDIDFFLNKLFRALRMPPDFMGGAGGGNINLLTPLSQQDIRVARFVRRLQRAVIRGLTDIAQIHLSILGLSINTKTFQIRMSNIIAEDEQRKADLMNVKMTQANDISRLLIDAGGENSDPRIALRFVLTQILEYDKKQMGWLGFTDVPPEMIKEAESFGRDGGTNGYFSDYMRILQESSKNPDVKNSEKRWHDKTDEKSLMKTAQELTEAEEEDREAEAEAQKEDKVAPGEGKDEIYGTAGGDKPDGGSGQEGNGKGI